MGVREVVSSIHPISIHGAKILHMKLDERAGKLETHAETLGESIGLKLEFAREDVHEELDDRIHGRQGVGEEDEANDDGVCVVETKRGVEGLVVDEDGKETEDVKKM